MLQSVILHDTGFVKVPLESSGFHLYRVATSRRIPCSWTIFKTHSKKKANPLLVIAFFAKWLITKHFLSAELFDRPAT